MFLFPVFFDNKLHVFCLHSTECSSSESHSGGPELKGKTSCSILDWTELVAGPNFAAISEKLSRLLHSLSQLHHTNDKCTWTACGSTVYCTVNVAASPNPQMLAYLHAEAGEQAHSPKARTPLFLCVISCVRGRQPQLVKRVWTLIDPLIGRRLACQKVLSSVSLSVCIVSGKEAWSSDINGSKRTLAWKTQTH